MNFAIGIFCIALLASGLGIILGSNDKTLESLGLDYYWHFVLAGGFMGTAILSYRLRKNIVFNDMDYICLVMIPLSSIFFIGITAETLLGQPKLAKLANDDLFHYIAYFAGFWIALCIGFVGRRPQKASNSLNEKHA